MKFKLYYWFILLYATVCIGFIFYFRYKAVDFPETVDDNFYQGKGFYLIGPVKGQVLDAKTGSPLVNIPISLNFDCQFDLGFPSNPCSFRNIKISTDKDGKFYISRRVLSFPNPLGSLQLDIDMPERYTDFLLTYKDLRRELENGYFPHYAYYRNSAFKRREFFNFNFFTFVKPSQFIIYLVPKVDQVADCVNMKDSEAKKECISIFSYKSMEGVMAAGSVGLGAPDYFEKYFALLYDRQVNNICQSSPDDYFCITQKAIAQKDASICNEIKDNSTKERNDCEFITAIELGKGCDMVKTLSSNYYHDFSPVYSCKFYSAIRHSNASYCETISDEISWRPGCFGYLAKMQGDPSLCYKKYTNKFPEYKSEHDGWIDYCLLDLKR